MRRTTFSRDDSMIASDPDISAWVAANAGAGKTYTLANRVARLLLADTKPQKILCLTFTKAAAAEMQERLFRQLGEWAMLPDDDLRDRIIAIGGEAHTDLAKARRLFAGALETPGGLKVLTLHAFCQVVLSRFPLEAKIPPAFEVLDDQTAREMIAESRQRVLERAGSGEAALADAVARLVTETSEFTLGRILDGALGGDRRKLDRFFESAADLAQTVFTAHGVRKGETAQGIGEDFCAALARDIRQLKTMQAWLAGGGKSDVEAAGRLGAAFDGDMAASFAALDSFFLTTKGEPRLKLASKALGDAQPGLLAALVQLQVEF
jgi:ATP-dependent helicase/nuclease subunit A